MADHTKTIIATSRAPSAIGPYSQAVGYNGLFFLSGQIALVPETGEMIEGGVREQTYQIIDNLRAVLEGAGLDFSHVLRTTIYLADMDDFTIVNEIYGASFDENPPARATVEVSRLPKDARVEIDMIAAAPSGADTHDDHPGEDLSNP